MQHFWRSSVNILLEDPHWTPLRSVGDSPHLWLEDPSISIHAFFGFTRSCLSATLTRKFDEFSPIRSLRELKINELKLVVLITSPCSHLGAYEPPHCLLEGHGITCSQSALLPQLLHFCHINSFCSIGLVAFAIAHKELP